MAIKKPITLDSTSFPLHGARLIEASAGTGKTFTLCSLYLRLLLGHGDESSAHQHPLTVDQILVVTFTEAATEELRVRIRSKIHEARLAFSRGISNDPFIIKLMNDVLNCDLAVDLLLQAERQMDEAAVYTIHGFCQRMLVSNAFESGSLFETTFLTDENPLKRQVVGDYWRKRFYELPVEISSIIRREWKTPLLLLKEIDKHLSGGTAVFIKGGNSLGSIEEAHLENIDRINILKRKWLAVSDEIQNAFDNSNVNKRSYTKKSLPKYIESVTSWAKEETLTYDLPAALEKFSENVLIEKSDGNPPSHEVFLSIQEFIGNKPTLNDSILKDSILFCRELLKKEKEKIHALSFDDLLYQLNFALQGHSGSLLATQIRDTYPIAMIDEFQDTDPLQYSIFSSIYKTKSKKPMGRDKGIFMIGDPKQAIYAFRGADIFTYIKARREVQSHFTLNTNWRSTKGMVNSVNKLFEHSPNPFIFNLDINFFAVDTPHHAEGKYWSLLGEKQHSLNLWLKESDTPVSKKDYLDEMTEATVAQIKILLTLNSAQVTKGGESRQVVAGDLAILVRTGSEAKIIREALANEGVPSVYLSSRDSVFSTDEASDILRILTALNDPYNSRNLKSALATHLLDVTAEHLAKVEGDEAAREAVVLEFLEYKMIWEKRGIHAALRRLILNRSIAEKLLPTVNGERKITDYFHITELLQEESQKTISKHGLVRWLAEKIESPNGMAEDQQIRLESERELVTITTIHKSKGLEYNFVFLPFVASYRESGSSLYHDDKSDMTILDVSKSNYSIGRAEKERLAEDLRLLYVALTRAVFGCFVGLAPLRNGRSTKNPSGMHKSAVGWLIQQGEPASADAFTNSIFSLVDTCHDMCVVEPLKIGNDVFVSENNEDCNLVAKTNNRHIRENWFTTSFSALTSSQHASYNPAEVDFEAEVALSEIDNDVLDIFSFHKGAKAGTFLHTVFENIDFYKPYSVENKSVISELLLLEGYDNKWCDTIQCMTEDVLSKTLDGKNLSLDKLKPTQMICEMEFLFPINKLNARELSALCAKHDPLSQGLRELSFHDTSGMLKGFIDLTFEHEGKIYVLDWKSNHLGHSHECYSQDAIENAMRDHRYDLQYQIYSLALHKYLKNKISDYSYEENFGGAFYLFLRGVNKDNNNGVYFSKPSESFLEELDQLIGNN